MSIISCPFCGSRLQVATGAAHVTCRACEHLVSVDAAKVPVGAVTARRMASSHRLPAAADSEGERLAPAFVRRLDSPRVLPVVILGLLLISFLAAFLPPALSRARGICGHPDSERPEAYGSGG